MIPLCLQEGIGVVPWSPLARGILTRPKPADAAFRSNQTARSATDAYSLELYDDPADWDIVDAVDRLSRERGSTMAEVALAWVLSRPGVVAPIIGATKLDHLDSAVRALDVRLTAAEHAVLNAPYRPHPVRGDT